LLSLTLAACAGISTAPRMPTLTSTATPSPTATSTSGPSASPTPSPVQEAPRDLLDLARRFRGYPRNGPAVASTTPFDYQLGATETFKLLGLDQNAHQYHVNATLRAITDHAYFFVADDASYSQPGLDQITSDFESIVWPKVTAAFGFPWTPGVDGDPRITILHAALQGAGGYVSGEDEYPVAAVPIGNQREMLYIDQGALATPGTPYNALVAHELQHLVHFYADHSEDAWVNEGLSQVSWEIAGGAPNVQAFLDAPDTQLNFWPAAGDTAVHYAASELFFSYLLDHYGGRENAKALLAEQGNGINGVNEYLAQYDTNFDNVFTDFVVANLLDQPSGPYSHDNFDGKTTVVTNAAAAGSGQVSQYATDYLHLPAGAGSAFHFTGSTDVTIGIPPKDGAFWWSGRMDGMDAKLTRQVDLTSVTNATLTFDEWFDSEKGWDYSYVAASTDNGLTWQTLPGLHTTTEDPIGASFGIGYTGNSGGWLPEQISLDSYAGKKILLRFETVNDDSANLTGFAVDNIAIPQINLTDNANDATKWTAEGFSQVTNSMQQKFIVQTISPTGAVQHITLTADNTADIPLSADTTIAISAATPNTTQPASYTWTITP
jgi:hypothetical protein